MKVLRTFKDYPRKISELLESSWELIEVLNDEEKLGQELGEHCSLNLNAQQRKVFAMMKTELVAI